MAVGRYQKNRRYFTPSSLHI